MLLQPKSITAVMLNNCHKIYKSQSMAETKERKYKFLLFVLHGCL